MIGFLRTRISIVLYLLVLTGSVLPLFNPSFAQISSPFPKGLTLDPYASGGGGHDVPTPFEVVNSKAELADGEVYQLAGVVFFDLSFSEIGYARAPFFNVDLNYSPWLANRARRAFPYYELEEGFDWSRIEGKRVVALVRAHGKVKFRADDTPYYSISLKLVHSY
ncbi:MAG: hypothetical protein HYX41_06790 [Bdellovibrio sp.]|nr:hypothetical protein [Bdellovibrio sp.]